jgi:aldose 1-epimerase
MMALLTPTPRRTVALLLATASLTGGAACRQANRMTQHSPRLTQEPFGRAPDGQPIDLVTLRNMSGVEVRVATYGGIILSLRVPDKQGVLGDVVLGYESMSGYFPNPSFFGALIGRYANRIDRGTFALDGTTYHLSINDGVNHLHGGTRGWNQAVWRADPFQDTRGVGVTLTYTSPDGDQGYPGTVKASVTYRLTDDDRLTLTYQATSDRPTLINLTQHSYFNLGLGRAADILDHELTVDADAYTPVSETLIPTGEIAPVAGTPFDFRVPSRIGARIDSADTQLARGHGYDHNFVLNHPDHGERFAARLTDAGSGRVLEVFTTEPGLQFYTGNFLDGSIVGKAGVRYGHRAALCLETQRFPDSPNHPNFPSAVLRPGTPYRSTTTYKFSVRK